MTTTWYTLYDEVDGEIIGHLTSDEASLEANKPLGVGAIEGKYLNPNGFVLGTGQDARYVPYTDQVRLEKAHRPARSFRWDNSVLAWQDTRTLAEVKVAKNAQINEWRLQANYAGFTYAGKEIATDQLSLLDLTNTATRIARDGALPPNWPGGWKAKDNTYVAIATVGDWDAFYDAMYQRGLANFSHAQALKAQLETATSIAEVESITWA